MNIKVLFTTAAFACCHAASTIAADIVVRPGEFTIENALQQAREERRLNGTEDIRIVLTEGVYHL